MDGKRLEWIRNVAADCPYPPPGRSVDYNLGLVARHLLPYLLSKYTAAVQRAEAAENQIAALQANIQAIAQDALGWVPVEELIDTRKRLEAAEAALAAVPVDALRRWMWHSTRGEQYATGENSDRDYEAIEAWLMRVKVQP